MAFPILKFDSSTGSDSGASGAGPGDGVTAGSALTGSAAATNAAGTTVTLDGSPDLTAVATDGTHVLFLNDATAGNKNFSKITGKDNSAKTVTVEKAFGINLTNKAWAIGGKRLSLGSTTSRKLFDNNVNMGDAQPGWTFELASGYTETLTSTLDWRCGDSGGTFVATGILLRGTLGGTRPVLTFTNDGAGFTSRNRQHQLQFLEFQNTNASKTGSVAFTHGSSGQWISVIDVKVAHATNKFWKVWTGGSGSLGVWRDCEFGYAVSHGLDTSGEAMNLVNCWIHHCGGIGYNDAGGGPMPILVGNLFSANGAQGVKVVNSGGYPLGTAAIVANTFDGNGGDGLYLGDDSARGIVLLSVLNNIFSNNGGYGLNLNDGTNINDARLLAYAVGLLGNAYYNNTSGPINPSTLTIEVDKTSGVNPGYVDIANGDARIGTALKALGYPQRNIGTGSSTRSYVDPGAAQRQEAGGVLPSGLRTGGRL